MKKAKLFELLKVLVWIITSSSIIFTTALVGSFFIKDLINYINANLPNLNLWNLRIILVMVYISMFTAIWYVIGFNKLINKRKEKENNEKS
jgi:phosphotransferase system  glucose/maltose/N-acetylglucosamine-specific IIC component